MQVRRVGLLIGIFALAATLPAREKSGAVARTGLPTRDEQAALLQRQDEFRQTRATATIAVYPVQIGTATDSESADRIARLLGWLSIGSTAKVGPAMVLPPSAVERGGEGSVWELARSFREHLRQNPAATDYALFVSYTFDPELKSWTVLRYVLCKANGDLVSVEYQDLSWAKYQVMSRAAKSDCDEWIVFWLQRSSSRDSDHFVAING